MKRIRTTILAALTLAALAFGANVDGKWTGESKMRGGKKKGERTVVTTLNLATTDGKLGGTISNGAGQRSRSTEIQNAKFEDNALSFDVTAKTKKGEQTIHWEGTLKDDELKLEATGKGKGKKSNIVTLKRQP